MVSRVLIPDEPQRRTVRGQPYQQNQAHHNNLCLLRGLLKELLPDGGVLGRILSVVRLALFLCVVLCLHQAAQLRKQQQNLKNG